MSNGKTVMFDKTSYAELKSFDLAASKPITAIRADGNYMAAAVGNVIQVWDMRKWEKVKELIGHQDAIHHLDMMNGYVASGSNDHTVRVWSLESGTSVTRLNHLYPIRNVRIVNSDTVAAGGYKFQLSVLPGSPPSDISSVVVWRRRKSKACSIS